MKKIFLFLFLLPTLAFAQLELPYSIKLVNPKPVDFWYYESDGTPYDNTTEVTTQVISAIRYVGQTFNVNGVEYWFGAGITDPDLVAKGSSFTLTDGNGTTANGSAVDLGGTQDGNITITPDGNETRSMTIGSSSARLSSFNTNVGGTVGFNLNVGEQSGFSGTREYLFMYDDYIELGLSDPAQSTIHGSLLFNTSQSKFAFSDDSHYINLTSSGVDLHSGSNSLIWNGTNLLMPAGDIGATGTRITKGWFTDLQVTNAIAGSITGNAATVTTNANLTGDVTSSGNATTIAAGAVDIAMLSATGTPSSSTYLRGDNTWAAVSGSGDVATDAIWDAAGDLAVGTGANTAARLAMGSALQVLRVNAGATALEWAAPTGGITNSASATELMKSNGTNAISSGISVTSTADMTLGASLGGSLRYINIDGSAPNIDFSIDAKGSGVIRLGDASTGGIRFSQYTGTSSFTGTPVGYLQFDASGNILTAALPSGSGDMTAAVYDPATIAEQVVGLTATQTLTNKTIDFGDNTITTTKAELIAAVSDDSPLFEGDLGAGLAMSSGLLIANNTIYAPTITANNYTLIASDNKKILHIDNGATAVTVTLPNSLITGFSCNIINKGTGILTIVATTTLESNGSTIEEQDAGALVYHEGSNVWTAVGALGTPLTLEKTISFTIGDATAVTTGGKTRTRVISPYTGTITGWYLIADQSTTTTVDVWKDAGAIPTNSNSITASAKPSLSGELNSSTTLTGWTTSVTAGDVLMMEVESNNNATHLSLQLKIQQ